VVRRTRIIFLGNPDNPTGAYVGRPLLRAFIERCPKDVVLLIDEAYREFVIRLIIPIPSRLRTGAILLP
ncbi:MAG: aminotransferase class I/II-fold pyridoxal phosphate-dependent enzyme, partial [Candidatus Omnitrophota bacterium]